MRFVLLSFACIVGCGGHVAVDTSDASSDTAPGPDTEFVPFDTSISDSIGPPTDIGPPFDTSLPPPDAPSCPLMADPCFAQYAKELATIEACMGHTDTCAASGNVDASGCGHRTGTGSSEVCTWPDGARTDNMMSGSGGSGDGINAKGVACFKFTVTITGGTAKAGITFGDGASFEIDIGPGAGGGTQTVFCPDGSKSRTFTNSDQAECKIGIFCCSPATPPRCG